MIGDIPVEPGLYFARSVGYEWWNLLVRVGGVNPHLYISWTFDLLGETIIEKDRPLPLSIIVEFSVPAIQVPKERPRKDQS